MDDVERKLMGGLNTPEEFCNKGTAFGIAGRRLGLFN